MSAEPFGVVIIPGEVQLLYALQEAVEYSKKQAGEDWVTIIFNDIPISVHAGTTDATLQDLCGQFMETYASHTFAWLRDHNPPAARM